MKPKSGHIYNNSKKDISLLSSKEVLSHRRKIGVIFQDFKLLPKKTVRENVAFAMEVSGYSNRMITTRVPEILSHV